MCRLKTFLYGWGYSTMAVTDALLLSQKLRLPLLCKKHFLLLCKRKVFCPLHLTLETANKCAARMFYLQFYQCRPTSTENWPEVTNAVLMGYWSPAEGRCLVGGTAVGTGWGHRTSTQRQGCCLSPVPDCGVWPCPGDWDVLSVVCLWEKGEVPSLVHWATETLPAHWPPFTLQMLLWSFLTILLQTLMVRGCSLFCLRV